MAGQVSIDLAFDVIEGRGAKRIAAFLHGILGRGQNLRSIARRFVEARPDWTARLVDLRGHGRSQKGTAGPSLEAAARDVVKLAGESPQPVTAIIGHSFGGKVALEAARIGSTASLERIVVIDSYPGVREPYHGKNDPLEVVDTIESLPATFASRSAFVEALIKSGKSPALAQWLAQSVEPDGGRVRFMPDTSEIRMLLMDYLSRDLWPVVQQPPDNVSVHLVIGDRSDAFSPADRDRSARISAANPRVTVDVLPAGHWVHVDDPDGLLRILVNRLG
jgi:esterase